MRIPVALSVVVLLAASLSGCVTIQVQPVSTADPEPTDYSDAALIVCGTDDVISKSGVYKMEGACPALTVEGDDIAVLAENIDKLIVRGDRNRLAVSRLTAVTVAGTENLLEFSGAVSIEIAGDQNAISSLESLQKVVINGDDNLVATAGGYDSALVSDSGARNVVGPLPTTP